MVDPFQLASDILQADAFFLLPAALWLFLFLFAWEERDLARRTGFGRMTFWLLLPGAVLGTIADLPFFGWQGDILAINVGGGLIPVILAVLRFGDVVGDREPATATLLVALAAETGGMYAALFLLSPGLATDVGLIAIAVAVPLALGLFAGVSGRAGQGYRRRTAAFLALLSGVLLATYASTSAVPSLGIVSEFPYYLVGPVAAGVLAVVLAPRLFGVPAYSGLPLGYAASTLGVLFGADLLRQPPLYGGPARLYAVGGAGPFDLVYLSGLIALGAAFLAYRWSGPHPVIVPELPAPEPSPAARLRIALQLGVTGRAAESIGSARGSTRDAALQARRLAGLPTDGANGAPWSGLGVPTWVVADQRNLDALADSPTRGPGDAFRAWVTARSLVGVARELDRGRLAALQQRVFAFLLDLALLTAPSVLLWVYLARTLPGSDLDVLGTPLFNAAAVALPAYGFLYFLLAEALTGTTLGKLAFGLRVTDRNLAPVGLLRAMVRNLANLVPLSVLGLGGSLFILTAVRGTGAFSPGPALAGYLALIAFGSFVAVGVALPGAVGALAIHESSEGQRLGDRFAGTWVVRDAPTSAGPAARVPAGAAGPSG